MFDRHLIVKCMSHNPDDTTLELPPEYVASPWLSSTLAPSISCPLLWPTSSSSSSSSSSSTNGVPLLPLSCRPWTVLLTTIIDITHSLASMNIPTSLRISFDQSLMALLDSSESFWVNSPSHSSSDNEINLLMLMRQFHHVVQPMLSDGLTPRSPSAPS
jgi:hypothetical protein